MTIEQNISQFIQFQFPDQYREKQGVELTETDRSVLVDFVEAYYEWLEEIQPESFLRARKMFEYRDVDSTLDEFISYFRSKYMNNITYTSVTDERFMIKNIIDLYRSKGSEASVKLLLRLLFNVDSVVYFPGQDVLRASDSRWFDPIYVEVLSSKRSASLINKFVFGSTSGATAFVESVVTKRSNNRLIDILYLSNVNGTFTFGDIITDDGIISNGIKVIGSLSDVEITGTVPGGSSIGEIFNVVSEFGINGQVRVTGVSGVSGLVDFHLVDGGYGYTLTDDTEILISDVIPLLDNSNTVFETGDTVTQKVETIYLTDSDIFPKLSPGNQVQGNSTNANTTPIAGTFLDSGTELIGNIITPYIKIQLDSNTTFRSTQDLTLVSPRFYRDDRAIKESSEVTITVSSANNTFSVGETVIQQEFLAGTANTISSIYNFGVIDSKTDDVLYIREAFGDFVSNTSIVGETSGETDTVIDVNVTREGAEGTVIGNSANTVYTILLSSVETFSPSHKIRGVGSKVIGEISSVDDFFIDEIEYNSVVSNVSNIQDDTFVGVVLEQDLDSISIATSKNQFFYVESVSEITNGTNTITIDAVSLGSGASFDIGSLENTETITIATQRIIDQNTQEVRYEDILLDGRGSGIGYVDTITVIDGGTGYANTSTVTISGGGFENQNPMIDATASVTTDVNGVITSVTVTNGGEGYFDEPTITVSDGSGANLSITMVHGYGFPEEPLADSNTIVGDALSVSTFEIGTIAELDNVTFGQNYDKTPAVSIVNPPIVNYGKRDQILTIDNTDELFVVGEIITTQANTSAKGIILEATETSLLARNISFEEDFIDGQTLVGQDSGETAIILNTEYDDTEPVMGENASVSNFAITVDGGVASLSVINSGIGYQNDEIVRLENDRESFEGITSLNNQGIEPGFWKSRTSHLSSEKKLHDNDYYQEYSYDVQTSINIEDYKDIVLDILHIAGTKFFGSVVKTTENTNTIDVETSIVQS